MHFSLGPISFRFWLHRERPIRFKYPENYDFEFSFGATPDYSRYEYQPFFWINITCWSGNFSLPVLGEKYERDLKTGKLFKNKVLRCTTGVQGNIGRLMFWIEYSHPTTCVVDPVVLKKLDV